MWTTLEKSFHKSIKAGAPMQVMNHLRSRRFLAKSRTGKQSQLHNGMFHKGAGPTECSHWERNDEQVCHVTTGAAAVDAVLDTEEKSRWAGNTQHLQGFLPSTRLACPHYTAFLLPGTPFSPGRAPHLGRHSRNKEHTIRKEQHREKWN